MNAGNFLLSLFCLIAVALSGSTFAWARPVHLHPVFAEDGTKIRAIEVLGNDQGTEVLILPGVGESERLLSTLRERFFRQGYKVYQGEPRLFGQNQKNLQLAYRNGVPEMAHLDSTALIRFVLGQCERRKPGGCKLIVWGHSLGGLMALAAVSQLTPELRSKIVITTIAAPYDLKSLNLVQVGFAKMIQQPLTWAMNFLGPSIRVHNQWGDFLRTLRSSPNGLAQVAGRTLSGATAFIAGLVAQGLMLDTHLLDARERKLLGFQLADISTDMVMDLVEAAANGGFKDRNGRPLIQEENLAQVPIEIIAPSQDHVVSPEESLHLYESLSRQGDAPRRLEYLNGRFHDDPLFEFEYMGRSLLFQKDPASFPKTCAQTLG